MCTLWMHLCTSVIKNGGELYFIASAFLFSVDVFVGFVVGEDRIAATVKIVLVLQPRQTN